MKHRYKENNLHISISSSFSLGEKSRIAPPKNVIMVESVCACNCHFDNTVESRLFELLLLEIPIRITLFMSQYYNCIASSAHIMAVWPNFTSPNHFVWFGLVKVVVTTSNYRNFTVFVIFYLGRYSPLLVF